MKNRKFIFGCVAGLLFMVFAAVNVTISLSYQGDEPVHQVTLQDLTVMAQSIDECWLINECISGKCVVNRVTSEKIYWFAIDLDICRPRCLPDGIYCCPVELEKWCYP